MSGLELLLEEDKEFVLRKNWDADVVRLETGERRLVIHNFRLSEKYIPREVDLLIRLSPLYPVEKIDMFWTKPDVVLAENNQMPGGANVHEANPGMEWQRWSRHPDWRPGIDNLETFFSAAILQELT